MSLSCFSDHLFIFIGTKKSSQPSWFTVSAPATTKELNILGTRPKICNSVFFSQFCLSHCSSDSKLSLVKQSVSEVWRICISPIVAQWTHILTATLQILVERLPRKVQVILTSKERTTVNPKWDVQKACMGVMVKCVYHLLCFDWQTGYVPHIASICPTLDQVCSSASVPKLYNCTVDWMLSHRIQLYWHKILLRYHVYLW